MAALSTDRLKDALNRWCDDHGFARFRFFTHDELIARKEDMADDADFHAVMIDVGMNSFGFEEYEDFHDLLRCHGFWYEQGYEWSLHFYDHRVYDAA